MPQRETAIIASKMIIIAGENLALVAFSISLKGAMKKNLY